MLRKFVELADSQNRQKISTMSGFKRQRVPCHKKKWGNGIDQVKISTVSS